VFVISIYFLILAGFTSAQPFPIVPEHGKFDMIYKDFQEALRTYQAAQNDAVALAAVEMEADEDDEGDDDHDGGNGRCRDGGDADSRVVSDNQGEGDEA
jgi:hypothetical protein